MRSKFTIGSFFTVHTCIRQKLVKGLAMLLLALFLVQVAQSQLVYAVSSPGNLISFNATAPGTILTTVPLTGIAAGQVVEGLDFRPATGQLYMVGYNAANGQTQLYTIKLATGTATPLGSALTLATGMSNLSVDFNPVPDRIRLTSSSRQSYRLNPNDGTLSATDGTLTYAAGDPNAAAMPNVVTVAYTNAIAGATATTLYFYDFSLNNLGTINPPNNGTLNTVGSSGLTANNVTGLDLDITTDPGTGVNTAYLSADINGASNNFYTVNLSTGAATLVGTIGGGKIIEMAVTLPVPARSKLVYAAAGGNLISFNSATPGTILSTVAITGLGAGETILGMDFRPATGQLYALGSASRLYTINLATGAATQVGSSGAFTLSGTKFGFDFNPVPDRIRVVSNTEQNLRLNPNDGTLTATDGALAYAATDPNAAANPTAGAVAYLNSYAGATSTTLYFYDYNLQNFGTINPPNNGTLNTIGGSGISATDLGLDMDISSDQLSATNTAFLTSGNATTTSLYRLNLSNGAVTLAGVIGGGSPVSAMAVYMPPPAPIKAVYALTSTGNLVSFNSNVPGTILTSVAVTGITAGQVIEGLDFRPANNMLYALGYNSSTGQTQLYTINATSGVASAVGSPVTLAMNLGKLAVDFNPQVDRLRVISSTGMNYRLNPNDGSVTATDNPLSYAAGDVRASAQPAIHAGAYTNNFAGTTSTVLYYYDFNVDNLAATLPPTSPNLGQITSVGSSGINALSGVDIDIMTNLATGLNVGFLTAGVTGTGTNFYTIDLATGETKIVGTIGGGNIITEMAVGAPDVVFPITLARFTAHKAGITSELSWTTLNELNNDYFFLQRSTDGKTFISISGRINSKEINGTSSNPLHYFFTDMTPQKGTNYYRLLQADKDGNIRYSNVLKVTFDGRYEIKLYPNPAKTVVNITGYLAERADLNVKLTDGSGKSVLMRNYKNQKGNWKTEINVALLPAGMYYLQITEGANNIHTQVLYKE